MSTAMDLYLSANDSLSFQDVLDIDIKAEIDTLVGGHNDLSGLNFAELPPLELDDVQDIKLFSTNSNHSNSSLNLDFNGDDCSAMVNPNAIMPVISSAITRSPSPAFKESHLTFSPSTFKLTTIKQEVNTVKKDLSHKLQNFEENKPVIRTITRVTPVLAKPTMKSITKSTPTLLTFSNSIHRQIGQPINVTQVNNITTVRTFNGNAAKRHQLTSRLYESHERAYPKPAYSYSCLIAMALKNSKNGSLPVSEIYNFMCKHFPYFKTAPNGWKNSVRHNLSLNKCFEKIEKPAVNGAQRKGCLWAMNPEKINKMDEEVQKWSKKDPSAIKRAMVNPDTLEALERGEMKFSSCYDEIDNFGDSCGSAESEEISESEQEEEDDEDEESNFDAEYDLGHLINVSAIQSSNEEGSDLEIETDGVYEEDLSDQDMLRVEVALAEKELLQYEQTINNKRRRTLIVQH